MLPGTHILAGFVFAYILVYFFSFSLTAGLIIFLASVLIDLDHYIIYTRRTKDYNLLKAYNYWISRSRKWRKLTREQKAEYKITHFFFHGIEFIILLIILSFISNIFYYILIGTLFHMLIDYFSIFALKDPPYIKFSQIYLYIRNKTKKEFKL